MKSVPCHSRTLQWDRRLKSVYPFRLQLCKDLLFHATNTHTHTQQFVRALKGESVVGIKLNRTSGQEAVISVYCVTVLVAYFSSFSSFFFFFCNIFVIFLTVKKVCSNRFS